MVRARSVMPAISFCNVDPPRTPRGNTDHRGTSRRRILSQPVHGGGVSTQPLVLVADDEPRITKLVSIALSEEGFRVVTANGGEEALAKAEEVRPDIVLLDIV